MKSSRGPQDDPAGTGGSETRPAASLGHGFREIREEHRKPEPDRDSRRGDPGAPGGELRRVIGFWDASALVVGLIIGSGIFRSPASIAGHLPSAPLILLAWVIGGALSLAGGLAAAELGIRFPLSGGQYVFLRESFGPAVAFSYGWTSFLISKPSILAGIATVFATYASGLAGIPHGGQKLLAMGAIAALTFVNCLGVKSGTRTQNGLTAVKTAGLALLGAGIFAAGKGHWDHLFGAASGAIGVGAGAGAGPAHALPVAMALGLVTVLYTYDGWIDVTNAGGEVLRPERVLPRAILMGTSLCVALYLLVNAAYLYVLDPVEMSGVENVAAVALQRAFGPGAMALLSVLVVVSTLGILNGSILTGVRVPFAMARDGILFAPLGRLDRRTISPVNALIAQGVLSCLVVLFAAGFDEIASLFVSTTWFFYAVSCAGLLVLRYREARSGGRSPSGGAGEGFGASAASRPAFIPRIPFAAPAAVLFIVVTLFIIGSDLVFSGPRVLLGMAIVVAAIPGYWLRRSLGRSRPSPAP